MPKSVAAKKKVQHTRGPWEVPGRDGAEWVVCAHKSLGKRRTLAHFRNEADARLTAAAPDLLEALIEISCNAALDDAWLDPVRAAIAKVTA